MTTTPCICKSIIADFIDKTWAGDYSWFFVSLLFKPMGNK